MSWDPSKELGMQAYDHIATGAPQILFPVPIPISFDWDRPFEDDYVDVAKSILSGDIPLWLGVLVDRATRLQPTGTAFAHIRFLYELNWELRVRTLVAQASVSTSCAGIPHFRNLADTYLAKVTDPPSANCVGVAITGPGPRYGVCRLRFGEPLFSLRRRVRNKWAGNRSLLLTGGWVQPPSWIGPWLRERVIPECGLDHLLWWEWSDGFPN
jgi:hypothetical protein